MTSPRSRYIGGLSIVLDTTYTALYWEKYHKGILVNSMVSAPTMLTDIFPIIILDTSLLYLYVYVNYQHLGNLRSFIAECN